MTTSVALSARFWSCMSGFSLCNGAARVVGLDQGQCYHLGNVNSSDSYYDQIVGILVKEITYTHDSYKLLPLQFSLIPFLASASSLYKLCLSLCHFLYHFGLFHQRRHVSGVSMSETVRHVDLTDKRVSTCVGASQNDRVVLSISRNGHLQRLALGQRGWQLLLILSPIYGYINPQNRSCINGTCGHAKGIGAIVLDDGMQHLSLLCDVGIVMVNGMMPWGNHYLVPLEPLREPLTALRKACIAIIHHADLISKDELCAIVKTLQSFGATLPVFFSTMALSCLVLFGDTNSKISLKIIKNQVVLCVSAISFPNASVKGIEKIGPLLVDRLNFNDHHSFQDKEIQSCTLREVLVSGMDIEMMIGRLGMLESKFNSKPFLVVTEKDYDRVSEIFTHFALHSQLQIITHNGQTVITFQNLLMDRLGIKLSGICQTSLEFPYHA
ncbi:Tetraacyldisaccharide 4'-kinase [Dillenia turbinata]|uniref:tetraacyldisaccharide 4'-kinase n=1 Tax=Dillenia turbinata TaxID=194707 RepID=A0AAN8WBV5_9MAGN